MLRLLSHLLLALTLLCNGVAATHAHTHRVPGAAQLSAAAAHVQHPHGHSVPVSECAGMTESPMDCCLDTDCACGCLLPQALPALLVWRSTLRPEAMPDARKHAWIGQRREQPPLRPPAG